jgi:outer membrane receptor protein involved in Fe transport
MIQKFISAFLILILYIMYSSLFAGTTGKISGRVTDLATGDPLPGVNIILVNSQLGTYTDAQGRFFILNIPPGIYQVEVSMLGYQKITKRDVKVSIDLTTQLIFQLSEAPILGEEVVVVAERPLIQKDITSKQTYIDSREITELPVRDFKDVLALQAGVSKDAAGRLHIRGGRSGEIAYLIDGVYVDDPLKGGFDNELEESNQARQAMSGNLGLSISEEAIDEMVVISGTFNAEYGNVMSGVVNIVTKEPSRRYTGKLEVTSGYLNNSPYRQADAIVQDKNPILDSNTGERLIFQAPQENFQGYPTMINIPGQIEGSLSGPIPVLKKLSVFFSGKYSNLDSYLPHGFNLDRNYFAKITYFASSTLKLNYTENYSNQVFQIYSHPWKYIPQNQGLNDIGQRRHILNVSHTLTSRMFYTLNLSLSSYRSEFGVWDWINNRFKNPDTEYQKGEKDNELEFYIRGTDNLYLRSNSDLYSAKGDFNLQAGQHHELKSGFELRYQELNSTRRLEPWPQEGGVNLTIPLDYQPLDAAIYFQDKIEYSYFIINAGLRLDYVDVNAQQWQDISNPESGMVEVPPRYQLSPRLGMAFPISEEMVFHFSYGHFFQFPGFSDIYTNLIYQNPANWGDEAFVLVGNPGVNPQKTVSYEAGLKFQATGNSVLEITAYYKDLENLLGTYYYRVGQLYRYSIFRNVDYGSVKGIDFSWRIRHQRYFSGTLNYSYSVASGNASFPTQQAYNAYYEQQETKQEYPLDFDRRHVFSSSLTFTYPENNDASFWVTALLSNLSLNMVIQIASGYPYTPITDDPTLFIPPNSARMPWTSTVDVRLEKRWPLARARFGIFMEATNIFDTLNALRVQPFTGRLWDTGKLELLATGTDYVHDPSDAGPPRLIRAGALITF